MSAVTMGLKVDFIDLCIYDCITSFMFTDKCRKVIIHNDTYYWINPSFIIKELPLLGITTERGINKRIDNLINAELLIRCPQNQSLKASYYKVGKKYEEYMFHTWNESSNLTWNESSNNNNNYIDNTTKENKDKSLLKESAINYDVVLCKWESLNPNLPSIRNFNKKRKQALQTLLKNNSATIDDLYKAFEIISVCSFCQGNNDRKWTATLDWLLNDTKSCFNRLLEGAYAFNAKEKELVKNITNTTKVTTQDGMRNAKGEIWSEQLQKWLK